MIIIVCVARVLEDYGENTFYILNHHVVIHSRQRRAYISSETRENYSNLLREERQDIQQNNVFFNLDE